ncbi:hypothetical protein C8Q75DRAFT_56939 [Abortiporus biennis]|nr:hypothetical protein C8Q75DRAFT_56939 [Abortiporus biennis]
MSNTRTSRSLLANRFFFQYSLVGRQTLVYNVTTNVRISDRDLVLKMSWQGCTRLSEAHILNHAVERGVEHIPELHTWTESQGEYRLSQGVRGKLFPGNRRDNGEEFYVGRSLHFMVFTKYEPITLVISPSNVDYIFTELIACLERLQEALIIHRDLSISNLMHDSKRLVGRKPYFILNDFDLATFINPDGTPTTKNNSKHLTRTLPFIAREILENPSKPHYLRHDLESVVYMAFWIGVNYPFGPSGHPMRQNDALVCWEEGDITSIVLAKTAFYDAGEIFDKIWESISSDFDEYGPQGLQNAFLTDAIRRGDDGDEQ